MASLYLNDVEVLKVDNFDNLNNWTPWSPLSGTVSNGMFNLQGGKLNGLTFKGSLGEGSAALIEYKTLNNTNYGSQFVVTTGAWQTDSFRQIGIFGGPRPKASLYQGSSTNTIAGNNLLCSKLTLQKDTWYSLLVAIAKDADFLSVISDPENPAKQCVYHEKMGTKWTGLQFQFQAIAEPGENLELRNFALLSFSSLK